MGKASEVRAYQRELAADSYEGAIIDRYLQEYQATQVKNLKDTSNRQQYQQQLEINNLERQSSLEVFDKNQQAYNEQLRVNKENAELQIQNQANIFSDRLTDIEFRYGDLQKTYEYEAFTRQMEYKKATQSFADAVTEFGLQQAEVDERYRNAAEESLAGAEKAKQAYNEQILSLGIDEAQRTSEHEILKIRRKEQQELEKLRSSDLLNKQKQIRAEYNFSTVENMVRETQSLGDIRSRGQAGVSQKRLQSGASAIIGLNQAQIADSLYRSEESIKLEQLKLKSEQKSNEAVFKQQKELNESFLGTDGFIAKMKENAKKSANLTLSDAIRTAKQARRAAAISTDRITAGKRKAEKEVTNRKREITKALGVSTDRFNMNAEILGKTLVSAAQSTQVAINNIEQIRAGNDMKAYAARMLPPRFSADPAAPFEVPEAKFVDPIVPPDPVKVPVGQPKQESKSTLGTILGIGGAVLGIAGAAFTGGASLALASGATTGFFAGGTAAALGTGLTGVGTGLGTIGSYL